MQREDAGLFPPRPCTLTYLNANCPTRTNRDTSPIQIQGVAKIVCRAPHLQQTALSGSPMALHFRQVIRMYRSATGLAFALFIEPSQENVEKAERLHDLGLRLFINRATRHHLQCSLVGRKCRIRKLLACFGVRCNDRIDYTIRGAAEFV